MRTDATSVSHRTWSRSSKNLCWSIRSVYTPSQQRVIAWSLVIMTTFWKVQEILHLNAEMEPGLRVTGHWVSDFGRVGSGHGSVCQTRCLTRFWVLTCAFVVALFLQSNTISAKLISAVFSFGFGLVPVTALLVYLFQLVPVTFTYLRADCPCDVTM